MCLGQKQTSLWGVSKGGKGKGAGWKTGLRLTEIWECLEEGTVLLRSIYHLTDVAICDRMCGISQCGLT